MGRSGENSDNRLNEVDMLLENGDYPGALRILDKSLKLDPDDAGAWYNKGFVFDSLDRFDEALQCYDRALELDPDYVSAWYSRGIALCALDRFDGALQCYDRVL